MDNLVNNMNLSLICTPIGPMTLKPTIEDIYVALRNICPMDCMPSDIYEDPPNYIMKFTSPNHKNAIEAHKAIITPRYTLSLTNGLLTTRTELSHGVHKC